MWIYSSAGQTAKALVKEVTLRVIQAQVVTNGGFESGLSSWTTWGSTDCAHGTSSAWVNDGASSYRLVDSGTSASCGAYQPIPVNAGLTYTASVRINVISGTPQLYLRWVNDAGSDVGTFPLATAYGPGVSTLQASGTVPTGATYARVWVYSTAAQISESYADSVTLIVNH